jgi:RHS repeat-associated protein
LLGYCCRDSEQTRADTDASECQANDQCHCEYPPGGETTSFTYTWIGTTAGVQSIQTSLPVISAAQNGPGTADVETVFLDSVGRPNWYKDADGFIYYVARDQASGAAVKEIDDVDTTQTGDFSNLPAGWTTPSGGGLHLLSTAAVDGLGRATSYTDPNGNVTYVVYNDTNYEVRVYPGWQSGSGTTTGPTIDYREDRLGSYLEALTMSATPHTTGGVPDGTEAISNLQTLARVYINNAGESVREDDYFNLSGVTWSTAQYIGTQNTDYYTTLEDYDSRGRAYRTLTPTGTYYKTLFDGLDRPTGNYVGTNDGSPGNMTQIVGFAYDNLTAAPSAPSLSQVSGGTMAATTYYVKIAYVFNGPAGPGSSESSLAVSANKLLQVASPATSPGATGYNVYVATASGSETLQNSSPVAIGTAWTEPTTGLISTKEAPFTSGVGDSNLTQQTAYPGGSQANRVENLYYDWRDRLVATKDGVQASESTTVHRPIVYTTYDNLDEATQVQEYDGDGVTITSSGGVPQAPSSSLLRAQTNINYDDQQRVYQTQTYSVDPSSGTVSSSALNTYLWYNHRGDVIEELDPGGLATKFAYDGAERVTVQYSTDANGDAAPGTTNSWANAGTVSTSNNVLEQEEFTYDKNGNVIETVDRQRNHDETTGGPLGNETTTPKARVYYSAEYYDPADRPTASVDVGTNGGTAWTRPSTPPSASDTVLVATTTYNAAGWVDNTVDPRGIEEKFTYDNMGRVTKDTQAYTGNPETSNTDVSTEYTYDGMSHVLTLQADLPSSAYQQTKWIYGVTTSGGSGLNSNDIVSAVQHPDKSTGNPSSSEQDSQTVDALGETLTATDRNGNVHSLTYDVLGRLTSDAVTTLGSGVDGAVRRIDTAYDTQGNPYLLTSYADTAGTTIVNQVQRAFNGLGQLTQEWQAHGGAVNTSTTPSVQSAYTLMSGGQNNSRLTSITYPNGKVLNYNYNTGVDSTISRLSSLSDNSGTLESYSYLGLGSVVKRAHSQPGVDLTYIKQTGESNGDAGDQYTGLDRFGRVVDQRWINTGTGTATDRFKYGYDRDSNVLYRTNEVNHSFDELYHANASSNGYDNLNQLVAFARGTLNANHDTISSPSHSITYSLDAEGNFSSTTTDGGSAVNNTFNKQNEETAAGPSTLTFDANGNLTTDDQGHRLVYDAWNRLVAVKNGGTTLVSYKYDALGRRIVENPGTVNDLYYDAAWQILEERSNGVSTATIQYVWSPVYVDALVLRDRSTANNGTLDERLWVQQDANYNVTALVNGSGSVVERYDYDPYGKRTVLDASFNTRSSTSYAFVNGFQGLRLDTTSGFYYARIRDFSPTLGRFVQADPAGFDVGDSNFYRFEGDSSTGSSDPSGLLTFTSMLQEPKDGLPVPKLTPKEKPKPGEPPYEGWNPTTEELVQLRRRVLIRLQGTEGIGRISLTEKSFPGLKNDEYGKTWLIVDRVGLIDLGTDEKNVKNNITGFYNCFGLTKAFAGNKGRAECYPDPKNRNASPTYEGIRRDILEPNGFKKSTKPDPSFKKGIIKIVIFRKDGQIKHMAYQLENGWWIHKMGTLGVVIITSTVEMVGGGQYGEVSEVWEKPAKPEKK